MQPQFKNQNTATAAQTPVGSTWLYNDAVLLMVDVSRATARGGGCNNCHFANEAECPLFGACFASKRTDNQSVIFRKIELDDASDDLT